VERNSFEGGSVAAGRERIARALGAGLDPPARPARLLAALGDAVRFRRAAWARRVASGGAGDAAAAGAGSSSLPVRLFGDLLPPRFGGTGKNNADDGDGDGGDHPSGDPAALALPPVAGALSHTRRFPRRSRPTSIAYIPGGRAVAVGSPDGLVEVYDTAAEVKGADGTLAPGVALAKGGVFAYQDDDECIIVGVSDAAAVTAIAAVTVGGADSPAAAWNARELVLAAGTVTGRVSLFAIPAGSPLADFETACLTAVTCVAVAVGEDGNRDVSIAAGAADGSISVLGTRSGVVVARLAQPTAGPAAPSSSSGNMRAHTAGTGGGGGEALVQGAAAVLACTFLARGTITAVYADGSACLFDTSSGSWASVTTVRAAEGTTFVSASPLPDRPGAFAAVSIDGAVRVVDVCTTAAAAAAAAAAGGASATALRRPGVLAEFTVAGVGEAAAIAVTADGSRALVCGSSGTVHHARLWGSSAAAAGHIDATIDTGCKGGCVLAVCDPAEPAAAVTLGADSVLAVWEGMEE
jgi:hypothetical protein